MAARTYSLNSSTSESTYNTNTSDQVKVALTISPADNSTWVYIATCLLSQSSLSYEARANLYNINSAVTFSTVATNIKDTTDYFSVAMVGVETFGTSPGSQTIRLRYSTENTSGTVAIKDAYLTAIQLESTEPSTREAGPIDCSGTSYTDVESLTHTFLNGEDYYVLCSAQCDTNNASYRGVIRAYDGTTEYGYTDRDHDDAANAVPWATLFKLTGDGTSKTIKIQGASNNASGTNTVTNATIVAFRKNLFDNAYYAESRTRGTTTSTTYQDKATLTQTPEALQHLIIGCGVVDVAATTSSGYAQLIEGATSKGEHLHEPNTSGAAGGAWPYMQAYGAELAASSTTWKVQYKAESGTVTIGLSESAIVALQLEASAGGSPYTLTAETGSYTLTGVAAGLKAGRKLAGDTGSYTLTGQDAALTHGYHLTAGTGSYTLTGIDAGLAAARKLSAGTGSYTLTGQAAGLRATRVLTADTGSYSLTGVDAGLKAGRALTAGTGSYTLTGQDAALTYTPVGSTYTLNAEPGSYTLTGVSATLGQGHRLIAETGNYTITGMDATLTYAAASDESDRPFVIREHYGRGLERAVNAGVRRRKLVEREREERLRLERAFLKSQLLLDDEEAIVAILAAA